MKKDARLKELAASFNVARFFSCDSAARVRFAEIGAAENLQTLTVRELAEHLLIETGSVNVRSFDPLSASRSTRFVYGIETSDSVLDCVQANANDGLYSIVNETIDVNDGGVSGVLDDGVVEFGSDATPRGVESDKFGTLPRRVANSILESVYEVSAPLGNLDVGRVEFSIHPQPVGTRGEHVIVWEQGDSELKDAEPPPAAWPTSFAAVVGDKTCGLLIADAIGVPVAHTRVVTRRLSPFEFGRPTGSSTRWLRTAPGVQQQGRFTTSRRWIDPFKLLQTEDPHGSQIPAILAQREIPALFSGAATDLGGDQTTVEGVSGFGDAFMLGLEPPTELPAQVRRSVEKTLEMVREELARPVGIEWAWDGQQVWVLQLHLLAAPPATPSAHAALEDWIRFDPSDGLQTLTALLDEASLGRRGIILTRRVGVTSHIGDLLRQSGVPYKFEVPTFRT